MTIDIETLVLRGGLPVDETSITAILGEHVGTALGAPALAKVGRMVAESLHADVLRAGEIPDRQRWWPRDRC